MIETLRVQVPTYQMPRPQSTDIQGTLRPEYITREYMEPLGKGPSVLFEAVG